jgi:hypothetical protein
MNVEKLILLVKEEHQAIYDASDSDHRNRDYIASLWAKIAQEMDVGTWRALLFLLTLMMMMIIIIMTMIKNRNPNISDKVVVVCP